MRTAAKVLAVMCVMAFLGGAYQASVPPPGHVPVSSIDPSFCVGDGSVVAVNDDNDGIYHFRCSDGFTGVAPHR